MNAGRNVEASDVNGREGFGSAEGADAITGWLSAGGTVAGRFVVSRTVGLSVTFCHALEAEYSIGFGGRAADCAMLRVDAHRIKLVIKSKRIAEK